MDYKFNKVAVLGTGVMGSQIAAHLTNAGIEVYAFDMTQDIAEEGIEKCRNLKPSPFYNPKTIDMITVMNYNDNLFSASDTSSIASNVNSNFSNYFLHRF